MCTQDKLVCEFCNAGHRCGGLKQALVTLDSETKLENDSYARSLYEDFLLGVEAYGFNYGQSNKLCWLSDKPSFVHDLTDEAIRLLGVVRARRRKSA
jgi:hypothetical protein